MTAVAAVTSLDGFHATPTAQRGDELARALFDAVNGDDSAGVDAVLARSLLSYDVHGTRSRTGLKRYHSDLRQSFSDLRFEVHENIGVLVEGDLVALRTIITGTQTGGYAGIAPTGNPIQTSASHIFRVRDDQFVEHWQVVDTYRVLVAIGAIPKAANAFQQATTGRSSSPPAEKLSPGELKVLRYLPTNLSRPEIAGELSVSQHTVNTHIRSIYAKLRVQDRSSAVRRARELRLLAVGRTN